MRQDKRMNEHVTLTSDKALFDRAFLLLKEEYKMPVHQLKVDFTPTHGTIGTIDYKHSKTPLFVHCVTKKSPLTVVQIADYKNQSPFPHQYVFLTDYINPALAQRLKEAQIQFIDRSGNAYIDQNRNFIFVKGNKKCASKVQKEHKVLGKAFGKKGLQLIYILLNEPTAIDLPYRELAKKAKVSLGIIGDVLSDLDNRGYIDKNQKIILKKHALIKEWAKEYGLLLLKNLPETKYTTDNIGWYDESLLNQCNALLGGEVAANQYTHFLSSNKARVYISLENQQKLLRYGRLKKVRDDEYSPVQIELIEPSVEHEALKGPIGHLVNPLVVYAELLASNDVRNLEVAEKLYDQYLHHH